MTAERGPAATRAADGVQLVDEDDRGGGLPGLLEEVADARRTNAHDHLDEFGRAEAEEGNARLSSNRARQQRLAGSRRADQQDALRHRAPESLVLAGVLKKSTISLSSLSASSMPATSSKVTFGYCSL
jgi:hypothetical protein